MSHRLHVISVRIIVGTSPYAIPPSHVQYLESMNGNRKSQSIIVYLLVSPVVGKVSKLDEEAALKMF